MLDADSVFERLTLGCIPGKQSEDNFPGTNVLSQMNHVVSSADDLEMELGRADLDASTGANCHANTSTTTTTILVPILSGSNQSTASTIYHHTTSASTTNGSVTPSTDSGGHLSVMCTSSQLSMNDLQHQPPMTSVAFLDASTMGNSQLDDEDVDGENAQGLHSVLVDCNGAEVGHKDDTECENNGHQQHIVIPDDPLDMKPEPMDCLTQVAVATLEAAVAASVAAGIDSTQMLTSSSADTSLNAATPELPSITFPQLPTLSPYSTSPYSQSMNTADQHSLSVSPQATLTLSSVFTSPPTATVTTSIERSTKSSLAALAAAAGPGPYRCRDCDKEFRILRYLEKHRRIHTGEKPYQCCYCGRQFNDWPNMNRHKRIHTGERPYRCSVCTKTFSQPAVYNEHVKRHTGERPYICIVCTKGFPRAARLAVHMRVHTGERPYPCTSCDRRFSQPHHLAAHLRVHSGDRPYSCPKCEVSFACISNLRRHRKQVHPTSPLLTTGDDNECGLADSTVGNRLDEKKPSLEGLVSVVASVAAAVASNNTGPPPLSAAPNHCSTEQQQQMTNCSLDSSSILAAVAAASNSSGLGGMTNESSSGALAAAAAMSGTILTATGALMPAMSGSSAANAAATATGLSGLILTSGPTGTFLATPAQFAEQQAAAQAQGHLQPTLIAHTSGLMDGSSVGMIPTSLATGFPFAPNSFATVTSTTSGAPLDANAFKSVCASSASTVSFMLPTVLTAGSTAEALRQSGGHAVTFLTPAQPSQPSITGAPGTELDRATANATSSGHETVSIGGGGGGGGLMVNTANGETVYLEPLDPRMTFDSGQQFTFTTIPTSSNPHGQTATLFGSSTHPSVGGGGTHMLTTHGHPTFQLAPGSHIAFATNPNSHLQLNPNATPMFPTQSPHSSAIYTTGQATLNPHTVLLPQHTSLPPSSIATSIMSNSGHSLTSSSPQQQQLVHYTRPASNSTTHNNATVVLTASPGRPSSTPTQPGAGQTTTMLVPILTHNPVSANTTNTFHQATFQAISTSGGGGNTILQAPQSNPAYVWSSVNNNNNNSSSQTLVASSTTSPQSTVVVGQTDDSGVTNATTRTISFEMTNSRPASGGMTNPTPPSLTPITVTEAGNL